MGKRREKTQKKKAKRSRRIWGSNKSSPGSSHLGGARLRNPAPQFLPRGLLRKVDLLPTPPRARDGPPGY
jgi:hypothetical protein